MCFVMQRLIVFLLVARAFTLPVEKTENPVSNEGIEEKLQKNAAENESHRDLDTVSVTQLNAELSTKEELTREDVKPLENGERNVEDKILTSNLESNQQEVLKEEESDIMQRPIFANAEVGKFIFADSIKGVKIIPDTKVALMNDHGFIENDQTLVESAESSNIMSVINVNKDISSKKQEEQISDIDITKTESEKQNQGKNDRIIFEDEPLVDSPGSKNPSEEALPTPSVSTVDTQYSSIENSAPISLDQLLNTPEQVNTHEDAAKPEGEVVLIENDQVLSPEWTNEENLFPFLFAQDQLFESGNENLDLPISSDDEPISLQPMIEDGTLENTYSNSAQTPNQDSSSAVINTAPAVEKVDLFTIEDPINEELGNIPSAVETYTEFGNNLPLDQEPNVVVTEVIIDNSNDVDVKQNDDESSLKSEETSYDNTLPLVEHIPQLLSIEPIAEINTDSLLLEPVAEEPSLTVNDDQSHHEQSQILSIKPIFANRINVAPIDPIVGENSEIFSIKPLSIETPYTFNLKPIAAENHSPPKISPIAVEIASTNPLIPNENKSPSLLDSLADLMQTKVSTDSLIENNEQIFPLENTKFIPSSNDENAADPEGSKRVDLSKNEMKESQNDANLPTLENSEENSMSVNSLSDLLSSMNENASAIIGSENPSFGIFIDAEDTVPLNVNENNKDLGFHEDHVDSTSYPVNHYDTIKPFDPFNFYPINVKRRFKPQLSHQEEKVEESKKTKFENDKKITNENQSTESPYSSTDLFKALIKSLRSISDMTVQDNITPVLPGQFDGTNPVIIILNLPVDKNDKENEIETKIKSKVPSKKTSEVKITKQKSTPFFKPNTRQHSRPKFRPLIQPNGYNYNAQPYNHRRHLHAYYDTDRFHGLHQRNIPKHYYKFSYQPRMRYPYFNKRSFKPSKPVVFPNRYYY